MRALVNGGFKNNIYLRKGVLTGIFRIAKESIFSDLNNLNVCTLLSDEYKEHFGFTQVEVEVLLNYYNLAENISVVADWYNGYTSWPKITSHNI